MGGGKGQFRDKHELFFPRLFAPLQKIPWREALVNRKNQDACVQHFLYGRRVLVTWSSTNDDELLDR